MKRKVRLTLPQWVMLQELAEPMRSPHQDAWYFTHSKKRTLRVLAGLGLAEHVESDQFRIGYKLTDAGKLAAQGADIERKP